MDALLEANIEIPSPTLMNTRAFPADHQIRPPRVTPKTTEERPPMEQTAFTKADEAGTAEEIRAKQGEVAQDYPAPRNPAAPIGMARGQVAGPSRS